MKNKINPLDQSALQDYWRDGRENLKPIDTLPIVEYGMSPVEQAAPAILSEMKIERVYLNGLADYMAARTGARVVPGTPWPVVRLGQD